MNEAGVFHRSLDNFCYPIDGDTLHIRLQTAKDDVDSVALVAGDPHDRIQANGGEGGRAYRLNCARLPMRKSGTDGVRDFWEVYYRPPHKRARYFFSLSSGGAAWEYGETGLFPVRPNGDTLERPRTPSGDAPPEYPDGGPPDDYWNAFFFPYINAIDVFKAPEWASSMVWYQIFPERFCNGDRRNDPEGTLSWSTGKVSNEERYGGDLSGIIGKLDYVKDLGATGIYLTPVFSSPSAHKYDTSDYLEIDPSFGTQEDLKRLCAECHARGMKIMLDAVFNHSGARFGPWLDVLAKGRDSKYASWFLIESWPLFPDGQDSGDSRASGFRTFAFTTSMPKLDTANPEVRDFLIGVAEKYIRECGIDGWRLDVANEIDHEFWRAFRKAVKKAKPDAYIVGEIWHDSMRWLRGDQYDAVMNYRYGRAVSDFIVAKRRGGDGRAFSRRIQAIDFSYPLPVIRSAFNVLDSHDTDRFITRCGGDRALARLGWLLLWLLPGSPCLYYGSEVGMEGGEDPDTRRCMIWDPGLQDAFMLEFMKKLNAMKKRRRKVLESGERHWASSPLYPGLLGFRAFDSGEEVLCVLNRDAKPVPGGETSGIAEVLAGGKPSGYVDAFDGRGYSLSALPDLPPRGYLLLEKEEHLG